MAEAQTINVATARNWLADGGEIAFLDLREEGPHADGHPLLAINAPYSRLELDVLRLVPRKTTRVLLVDGNDGVAQRAAQRLLRLGYNDVSVLTGGVGAWSMAGFPLFPSNNVPSKAFAEIVEIDSHTPHITANELDGLRRTGTKHVVLDSRTIEEFNRFHVPGAQTCPGAELVYRFRDFVPDDDTLVVVSCAGRTRSIIGAQSLINAGVPNKVVSLQGGTQGWRLAGLELERNTQQSLTPVSGAAVTAAEPLAAAVGERYGVGKIDRVTLMGWQRDAKRTTYLLDVRTPEEFAAGHLPGSVSAPGGQLVQAIDRWVGTRGARLVLVDDHSVRATMTAHWLKQMGWEVVVLERALEGGGLQQGPGEAPVPTLPAAAIVSPAEAAALLADGAAAIALGSSAVFRAGHPSGAAWTIRPRLPRLPARLLDMRRIVVFTEDIAVAKLAMTDLAELSQAQVAIVDGGIAAWRNAGFAVVETQDDPPDSERIDFIFWNHDRHDSSESSRRAMQNYLQWELDLPGEIEKDGLSGFRVGAA
ncbi:MAG TPA: rhodanese-like domain-containing protein [Stellaceae bacterium]|jgi:rhodanese-related sulfurtransferase|nr:rhodanese-like domain-containing protein [Stellaceae bacterium]